MTTAPQQINLLQLEKTEVSIPFSFNTYIKLTAVTAIIFVLINAIQGFFLYKDKEELSLVTSNEKDITAVHQRLKNKADNIKQNHILLSQLRNKQKQLKEAQQLTRLLRGEQQIKRITFANYFSGLAEIKTKGLWLTKIKISDSGNHLIINGELTDGELLPIWLNELKKTSAFNGQAFIKLEIERKLTKENELSNLLQFKLDSQPDGDKSEG